MLQESNDGANEHISGQIPESAASPPPVMMESDPKVPKSKDVSTQYDPQNTNKYQKMFVLLCPHFPPLQQKFQHLNLSPGINNWFKCIWLNTPVMIP